MFFLKYYKTLLSNKLINHDLLHFLSIWFNYLHFFLNFSCNKHSHQAHSQRSYSHLTGKTALSCTWKQTIVSLKHEPFIKCHQCSARETSTLQPTAHPRININTWPRFHPLILYSCEMAHYQQTNQLAPLSQHPLVKIRDSTDSPQTGNSAAHQLAVALHISSRWKEKWLRLRQEMCLQTVRIRICI